MSTKIKDQPSLRPELPEWFNQKQAEPTQIHKTTCQDFLRYRFPKNEPILGKWLLRQSLNMIYGPRGCGKTFLGIEIAYAIATGTSIFDWDVGTPRKVLYLDGEMAAPLLQRRLRTLVKSRGRKDALLDFVTPDLQKGRLPDLSDATQQEMIMLGIDDDTEVIIIDNLSSWSKSGREDAETWAPIAEFALTLRSHGKAVIFIHHSGKAGTQRGTSRREDLLDTVIALKKPAGSKAADGAYFEVHFEKSRNLAGTDLDPFYARLVETDEEKLEWDWGEIKPNVDVRIQEAVSMAESGLTQTAIAKTMNVDKSTVSRWLSGNK